MSILHLAAMAVGGVLLYKAGVAKGSKSPAPPAQPETKPLNGFSSFG